MLAKKPGQRGRQARQRDRQEAFRHRRPDALPGLRQPLPAPAQADG